MKHCCPMDSNKTPWQAVACDCEPEWQALNWLSLFKLRAPIRHLEICKSVMSSDVWTHHICKQWAHTGVCKGQVACGQPQSYKELTVWMFHKYLQRPQASLWAPVAHSRTAGMPRADLQRSREEVLACQAPRARSVAAMLMTDIQSVT